jgi:hypothetical protein
MEVDWTREALATVASLSLFTYAYLIGSKRRAGWYFAFVGNGLWTIYGVHDQAWAIIAESLIFQVIALRGWWKWRGGTT